MLGGGGLSDGEEDARVGSKEARLEKKIHGVGVGGVSVKSTPS